MDRIIGIGEYVISDDLNDVLKTYALSSCVALTAYSAVKKILGMVHIALPNSDTMGDTIGVNPSYYADRAVPLWIREIGLGYGCNPDELEIRAFGGAASIRKDDVFHIGERNLKMIEHQLRRMNLQVCYHDTGGCRSRSLEADVATGTVKVIYQPLNI